MSIKKNTSMATLFKASIEIKKPSEYDKITNEQIITSEKSYRN